MYRFIKYLFIGMMFLFVMLGFTFYSRRGVNFSGGGSYSLAVGGSSSSAEIIVTDERAANALKKLLPAVGGESVFYFGRDRLSAEKEWAAELKYSSGSDYYYYSPLLGDGITVGGYYINMHISEREDGIIIGSPIIFGGS